MEPIHTHCVHSRRHNFLNNMYADLMTTHNSEMLLAAKQTKQSLTVGTRPLGFGGSVWPCVWDLATSHKQYGPFVFE